MLFNQHLYNAIKMTLVGILAIFCQSVNADECPQSLHDLPVPKMASTCHIFLDNFPAALSFYSPESPINLRDFYLNAGVNITVDRQDQGRFVLIGDQDQYLSLIHI